MDVTVVIADFIPPVSESGLWRANLYEWERCHLPPRLTPLVARPPTQVARPTARAPHATPREPASEDGVRVTGA